MNHIRNPFVPGAGTIPPELSGRSELLSAADTALQRVQIGRAAKSFIAVGLRGVGKTVVLNRVRQIAEGHGYLTVFVEAHEQKPLPDLLLPELRRLLLHLDALDRLNEVVKRSLRVMKSFMKGITFKYADVEIGLDIDPETGAADSGDLESDFPELMLAVGRAAQARAKSVAIIIDEIQYLPEREMSALIMAMHRIAQHGLPVLLVAAGLPQVVGLSGQSKSYAERLFDFPIVDALEYPDVVQALNVPAQAEGAEFTPEALQTIFATTQGYPYFLQEWGYHAWNAAPVSPITAADVDNAYPHVLAKLDESFFRVRFDRMAPSEKTYLRAMAELGPGPYRSGDVAAKLGRKSPSFGPVRNKLIAKGMIYSPAHGDIAFTVPLFDAFLRRVMPAFNA